MINPLQFIQQIKNGVNPNQMMLNMLSQGANNNPMMTNILNMAKDGDAKGIETFARNICKERGISYDEAFNKFKSQFGIN